MTATGKLAAQSSPIADPTARRMPKNEGRWRIFLGWGAAASLHVGLLAALIFSWPARLNPAPANPASVSLLIVAAQIPRHQPAVRPKSTTAPTAMPAAPPVIIANIPNAAKPKPQPKPRAAMPRASAPSPHSNPATPSPRGVVETKAVPQQDGEGFVAAQPISGNVNQPPEYPRQAYDHGEQGEVLLSIHVLPNGEADSVSVTQSSGFRILDQAAANAVWKWRFEPSTLAGKPVPSVIPYRIHFNLQNAP
jgi:protein TonB